MPNLSDFPAGLWILAPVGIVGLVVIGSWIRSAFFWVKTRYLRRHKPDLKDILGDDAPDQLEQWERWEREFFNGK